MAKKKADNKQNGDYSAAESLTYLEGLDGVRKRPGMYIGSVDDRGLTHCLYEILDNSVDEALAGHATHITVTDHGDGSFSVVDNGRGIPTDIEPKSGLPGVVLVMTKLHAGGKFGGNGYKVSGGLHGVGASVVNALSNRIDVQVRRDGKAQEISFQRGAPGKFAGEGPDAKFKADGKVRPAGRANKKDYGTTVRFWPDTDIFLPGSKVDMEKVAERCNTTVHLVPGLTVTLVTPEGTTEFSAPKGLAGMVETLLGDTALVPVITCTGTKTFSAPAQVLDGDKLVTKEVEREVEVEVALSWGNSYDYEPRSFVNVVSTPGGGTHLTGAERSITKVVQNAIDGTKLMKASEDAPVKDDVLEGLAMAVSVRVPEPEFEGQTKEILSTPAVLKIVSEVVAEGLEKTFGGARLKTHARTICTKVVAAARARKAARDKRDAVRKAKSMSNGPLPSKLRDCRSHDMKSELFLVEGDSAAGSVGSARDSSYQAYMPLRGKILNTARVTTKTMLENAECSSIIAAVGGGVGAGFDIERVRYGKISILVDADVDGSHIRCLLLTLFFKHMPELIAEGRVWASQPPLYRISTAKGEHHYCYSEDERDAMLADFAARGVKVADGIQRFKGLGEMNPEQLAETALEEETRRERVITMDDAERASEMFDKLMGDDASARREWLFAYADTVDLDDLDV
jgi:DNA gyrase subunit B